MLGLLEHETAEKARRAVIMTSVLLISVSKFLNAGIDWEVGPLHLSISKDGVLGGGFLMLVYFTYVFFARSYLVSFDFRESTFEGLDEAPEREWLREFRKRQDLLELKVSSAEALAEAERENELDFLRDKKRRVYSLKSTMFVAVDIFPPALFIIFAMASGATPAAAWRFIAS